MEDRDWMILQVLHEKKNITKTAQALFISQPALTARLRQIEKEFGITIVHRTSKGVRFTPQGEFLARSSAEVLLKLRKIQEQVLNLDGTVTGTLRLGASSYFTMWTLPPLLKLFKQQNPQVEFKVLTTWSKDIFNLVYNQEVHIGFVSSDYGWSSHKHLLFEEPIYVASRDEVTLKDLPTLPRINYQSDGLIKAKIDKWWRENFSQPPTISMEVDKLATCKEMIKHGLGYAIMPGRILQDVDTLHKIMLTDQEKKPILRASWMIHNEEALEMTVLKKFIDFVQKTMVQFI
ncbi:LysR family transcriptional regulator [Pelosinus sp. UFO1]|uniref:LysR family transcriptional regulator n=1 Tax=Pelosinus sp. UFO1 TaxID=484770 RepID=UPI0004D0EC37|nr:LysR family transcriptional regulator [Pelosinus sp. UFO1]AIF50760.1 transcriptional regulator, LysR family [Pelosinus sp. UFO1]